MTDEPFTLNEQQLELLCNANTYLLLETFKEPLNPSAAAKKLGLPANRVHYHVKRLAAAGLLRTVRPDAGAFTKRSRRVFVFAKSCWDPWRTR